MNDDKIQVKIEWEPDGDALGKFANHMLVTYDGAVYTLRFYQLLPPPLLNTDAAAIIDHITARHLTTLVVPAATLPSIVHALQDVLEKAQEPES